MLSPLCVTNYRAARSLLSPVFLLLWNTWMSYHLLHLSPFTCQICRAPEHHSVYVLSSQMWNFAELRSIIQFMCSPLRCEICRTREHHSVIIILSFQMWNLPNSGASFSYHHTLLSDVKFAELRSIIQFMCSPLRCEICRTREHHSVIIILSFQMWNLPNSGASFSLCTRARWKWIRMRSSRSSAPPRDSWSEVSHGKSHETSCF